MKTKQIVVLGLILGALACGILLKTWVRSSGDEDPWKKGSWAGTEFFSPAKIEGISIRHGLKTTPVELLKANGDWKVQSLWSVKADPAKIDSFLQKLLKAMQQREFRGKGSGLFRDFGIADSEAISIHLTEPHRLPFELCLGTQKAGEGYFVRQAKEDSVYFVEEDLPSLLGIYTDLKDAEPASDFWADLGLLNLDPEKVTKIAIYQLKGDEKVQTMGLVRETDPKDPMKISWKFTRKDLTALPDPDKILKFIAILKNLKAQKAVDPNGKGYGLESPVWQLVVTEGEKKTLLNAGPKDAKEDLYYMKASSGASLFGLSGSFFNDLNVDDTRFIKDAPAAIGSKKSVSQSLGIPPPDGQEVAPQDFDGQTE